MDTFSSKPSDGTLSPRTSPKSAGAGAALREIWVLGARGGPITHVIVPSSHPLRSGKTNVVPFPPYM